MRIVEDRLPVRSGDERGMQSQAQLGAEEPVEADLRREEVLGRVQARTVLELVRAPVKAPNL